MTIIGIDLGTSNSACAIWRDGKSELIPNRLGEVLTPSVVSVDTSGNVHVGQIAKEQLISQSKNSVAVFKRYMGTQYSHPVGSRHFTSTELSSLVLKSLKEDAEDYLGEAVTEAVISVPAYFNDAQRQATRAAGELAGLNVRRLINEPTAAAMAYGLHDRKEGTYIVLDMGGGTFDVSILEFFDGVMQVHASAGDNYLGGEDFTQAMVQATLEANHIELNQLTAMEQQILYSQLEDIKKRLGENSIEWSLQLEAKILHFVFTEQLFNQWVAPLILRSKIPIEQALSDANLQPAAIDEVVLVGGATRMKLFRQIAARMLGRLPASHINPDWVVAMGAAIQAGLTAKDAALSDMVLTDVAPYTLGTEVVGPDGQAGYYLPIIERNSVVPISVVRTVSNAADKQKEIHFKIFQGEHRRVEKNIFLGELHIPIDAKKAGDESLDIRYTYDMNGLLAIDLKVQSTGKTYAMVLEQSPGMLTAEQKLTSLERLEKLKFHPREVAENQALIARGERLYAMSRGERRDYIAALLSEFERILEGQNPAEILRARLRLQTALVECDS